jgi:hypothetical protein
MEDVGIFYDHLVYFTAIWFILWLFFPFWYVVARKIVNPGHKRLHKSDLDATSERDIFNKF